MMPVYPIRAATMALPAPAMRAVTERYWELTEPYSFRWGAIIFTAPTGWRTDGASIPRLLWATGSPLDGHVLPAAIAHDVLYSTHYVTRAEADRLFLDRMVANGVARWKAWSYYANVRAWGWLAWRQKPWAIDAARGKVGVLIGCEELPATPEARP